MKKKLLIIAASALACACLTVGLTACKDTLVHHAAKDPTCTARGNAEYWTDADGGIYSDAKGKNALDAVPELPALGHDWDVTTTTPATCTTAGTMTYSCKREGCTQRQDQVIAALGHDYEITVKSPASCTANGTAVRTCSRGDTHDEEITLPKGHNWGVNNKCLDCPATLVYSEDALRYEPIESDGENIGVRASLKELEEGDSTDIVVPYGVDDLPVLEVSFANAYTLTSVTLPSSLNFETSRGLDLEVVSEATFAGCSSLKSVTLDGRNSDYFSQDGVLYVMGTESTSIIYAPRALEGDVKIADGVTAIPSEAFAHRTALTRVTIPVSVTSFGYDAFYECTALEAVQIGDLTAWCGVNFENSFSNPLSSGAALYCGIDKVDTLEIPDGVTEISDYAFYGFKTYGIIIPTSVTRIGAYAFGNNTILNIIGYKGSFEQWSEILKADAWNRFTPDTYTLTCNLGGDEIDYDKAGNPKA